MFLEQSSLCYFVSCVSNLYVLGSVVAVLFYVVRVCLSHICCLGSPCYFVSCVSVCPIFVVLDSPCYFISCVRAFVLPSLCFLDRLVVSCILSRAFCFGQHNDIFFFQLDADAVYNVIRHYGVKL